MRPEEAVVFVIFLTGLFVVLRPIAAAIARRIGGEVPKQRAEVDEAVHAELHQLREDMDQLAERVDFAERLLAKQREAPRVGQGG